MEDKCFVFFCNSLSQIGGSQIYVYQKACYLKDHGWRVRIICCSNDNAMIPDLKKEPLQFPQMKWLPAYYSKRKRNKILSQLNDFIQPQSNVVIESHSLEVAIWAELYAKEHQCLHYIYLLQERFPKYNAKVYDFFDFKLKRHQLFGISPLSLEKLFAPYRRLNGNEKLRLFAKCGDTVLDVESGALDLYRKADYHIACFGRLEKKYMYTSVAELKSIAGKHSDQTFQVFVIGGSNDPEKESFFENAFNDCRNVSAVMTGFLYPVPKKLLLMMDFVISGAGSASSAANCGAITVAKDVEGEVIGILRVDTENTLFRESGSEKRTLEQCFDSIMENKEYYREKIEGRLRSKPKLIEYEDHLQELQLMSASKEYYDDVVQLCVQRKTNVLLFRILGEQTYAALKKKLVGNRTER